MDTLIKRRLRDRSTSTIDIYTGKKSGKDNVHTNMAGLERRNKVLTF